MVCAFLLGFGDSGYNTQLISLLGDVYSGDSGPAFALFKFVQVGRVVDTPRAPIAWGTTRASIARSIARSTPRAPIAWEPPRAPIVRGTARAPITWGTTRAPISRGIARAPITWGTARAPIVRGIARDPENIQSSH